MWGWGFFVFSRELKRIVEEKEEKPPEKK
jgi:hypothetical protein